MMSLPPEDEREEKPSLLDEPPFDPETDTRPLKPLHVLPDDASDEARELMERRRKQRKAPPPPPEMEDTHRVRLIPRTPDTPPWRVILQVVGGGRTTIGLDVRESLIVGRLDPDNKQNPDLDLSPHMAVEHGVSRQHAMLIPLQDALYLTDLQSSNGTWVNGEYLAPGQRHLLVQGDMIELGLLRLTVRSVLPLTRPS